MLKKIAVFGVLSIFGYTVFKRVFFLDEYTVSGGHVDSRRTAYEVDHDE